MTFTYQNFLDLLTLSLPISNDNQQSVTVNKVIVVCFLRKGLNSTSFSCANIKEHNIQDWSNKATHFNQKTVYDFSTNCSCYSQHKYTLLKPKQLNCLCNSVCVHNIKFTLKLISVMFSTKNISISYWAYKSKMENK